MEELIAALEKAILFLSKSGSSAWITLSPVEAMKLLEIELSKARRSQKLDKQLLQSLFAPTGSIQEISIDNDWGNQFIEISKVADKYI
jgi:hypothetical protein